jgi:hypothetical protein
MLKYVRTNILSELISMQTTMKEVRFNETEVSGNR